MKHPWVVCVHLVKEHRRWHKPFSCSRILGTVGANPIPIQLQSDSDCHSYPTVCCSMKYKVFCPTISYSYSDFFLLTFKDNLVCIFIPWSDLLSSCHSFEFLILYMYLEHPDNNSSCSFILCHIQFELHTFHSTQALFLRYLDLSQKVSSCIVCLLYLILLPDYPLPNLSFL